jgi:hypothetical protein
MADTLRHIGAQMANVMFNLAQRPGEPLTGDVVATMDSLRKQWDAALASRPAEVGDERQWVVVGGRRAGRTFLVALARDAERYRWMRNAQWFKAGLAKTELNASSFHYSGDLLDQLVDAGRAADMHGEGAGK